MSDTITPRLRIKSQPQVAVRAKAVQPTKVRLRVIPSLMPMEIELQNTGTMVQWRYVGQDWQDLIPIEDINASVTIGTVTTLPAGSDATVENVGTAQDVVLNFGIPEGIQGIQGFAATIAVGTVTTVDPSDPATVTNSGDENDAVFDFDIPQGAAATIAVGTVTTVDPADPATVTNVGTAGAAVFNFEIPKGDKGADGAGAVNSVNGKTGTVVLDADDIDDAATTQKFATAAQLAKVDHLTVTQAVDLDDVESRAALLTKASPAGPASLDLAEDTDNGAHKVTLQAPSSLAADRAFVLPDADVTLTAFIASLLNSTTVAGIQSVIGVREVLTANRIYYVRTDGNDSNDGLTNTAGGAFLTIQKAIDVACALDLSIYNVTIQLANGTYNAANALKSYVGAGPITIQGNTTTPANVVVNVTGGICFAAPAALGRYNITGLKMTGAYGILADSGSYVAFGNVDFGACTEVHAYTQSLGNLYAYQNYTISGGAKRHWYIGALSNGTLRGRTITLTGTPAFSVAFCQAINGGYASVYSNTFVGSATGVRYSATQNGVIDTNGGGASYLPGSSAGAIATGGQYI
ncbi:hypothetical protein PRN20_18270 [Devosia sp. ZB163]|uniref:hypothetical protein n=1 Tax=Devosia sp. ZB163 TaxID=3025938 RepID=UPI0023619A2E|nr:hypothetical protein [Devosia sp. ZB163]MDC9825684.1 hypothetical protein [Devosia sp. ZB163]